MDDQIPFRVGGAVAMRQREAGGRFPDIGNLVQETMTEFLDAIGPYLLGMLGLVLGYLIIGTSGGVVLVGLVAMLVFVLNALAVIGEDAGALLALIWLVANLGFLAVAMIGTMALTAPLHASFLRAVAAHQRGDDELQIASAFNTVTQELPRVVGVGALVGAAMSVGMLFCFFPLLLVPLFLGFAIPLVALHGLSPMDAARTNVKHVWVHLQDHAILALVTAAIGFMANFVPVLGPAFMMAFSVRAYRQIFGDGGAPELTAIKATN